MGFGGGQIWMQILSLQNTVTVFNFVGLNFAVWEADNLMGL